MPALTKDNLFQPDRYRVLLGERPDIGFCTVWNDPDVLVRRSADILKQSAIVGTLYSRGGVNIILRNLGLNPSITHLVVWGNGPLSNTPYGVSGRDALLALWKNGVTTDGTVQAHGFKLETSLDPSAVQEIVQDVAVHDLSDKSLQDAISFVHNLEIRSSKRNIIKFPEPVIDDNAGFPSEMVGWSVRGKTAVEAWLAVVDRILRYGVVKGSEHGLRQRELMRVMWTITGEDPVAPYIPDDWPMQLKELVGLTPQGLDAYRHEFLSTQIPENTSYTYGSRLGAYPIIAGKSINQLTKMVHDIKRSPDSRRAVATTMMPELDENSKNPPCLTQIQILQENGNLHLLATIRSNDIFKAALPNAFGLRALQKYFSEETGYRMGVLSISSESAHIYESDWEEAKKLWKCAIVERAPRLVFDPTYDSDPRGNAVITVEQGKIRFELQGTDGQPLLTLEGKRALELQKKIVQLGLLSKADHLMDIGMQLGWAEFCLANNLPFHQDRMPSIRVSK